MAAPSIGGSAVPTTLSSNNTYGGGAYILEKQEERQATDGSLYYRGIQTVTWEWPGMGTTEWAWWNTQWLRGTAMVFELWQDDSRNTTVTFTSGILHRPEFQFVEAGLYRKVRITISNLLPVQR